VRPGRALAVSALLAAVSGCTEIHWTASPYPIPLELAPGGALMARATVDGIADPFPVVIDTGTVLTTYDDGSGTLLARTGQLTLFGLANGAPIPRLEISGVPLFGAPLGMVGNDSGAVKADGILAGDILSRFTLALDYRAAAVPTMTVTSNFSPCNCELAPGCDRPDRCNAVLAFSLAGGQDTALQTRTRVVIGNDQYSYPPTRVLLDTCIEPLPDPLTTTVPGLPDYAVCSDTNPDNCPSPPYMPSGLDVRMIVATGFPGLALSESAYDRLRGAGAGKKVIASSPVTLHLPDAADGAGVQAGLTTLGRAVADGSAGASALALVSREKYYGPCASLARSRRHRRAYGNESESACFLDHNRECRIEGTRYREPLTDACWSALGSETICNDSLPEDHTPTPAAIELTAPIPVYVLSDVTPLLVGINADVRTSDSTVEGVMGTEALERMVSTIDYPGGRMIARCVEGTGCVAYPRLSLPSIGDCGFCEWASKLVGCKVPLTACAPVPAMMTMTTSTSSTP
jgi:hypothetical protein